MVELTLILLEQKQLLKDMLKTYEQELTGQENPGEYKYLDSYWEKETREPYFIKIDGKLAGFALVNNHTLIQPEGFNIAEFYIKKEFRLKGIGKEAAFKIFDTHHGKWETRQLVENKKAYLFWTKVINEYTYGNYKETISAKDHWQGPIQTFEN